MKKKLGKRNMLRYIISFHIGTEDLGDILNQLGEANYPAANFNTLGLNLGINPNEIATIEANWPRNADRCLMEIVKKWLQRGGDTSWTKLKEAISKDKATKDVAEKLDKN